VLVEFDYITEYHYNSNTVNDNNGNSEVIGVRSEFSNIIRLYYRGFFLELNSTRSKNKPFISCKLETTKEIRSL
jgi:hypothetical protein